MSMPTPPDQPKIYHILHVDRLASVVGEGGLLCDARIVRRAAAGTTIGMGTIKQRRMVLPVHCHGGTHVGEYVPFYFCARSIMLYVIHKANHPDLTYRGGQGPIVHLQADLHEVVKWADGAGRRWAFSLSNAGAAYAQFRALLEQLSEIRWPAVAERDFRTAEVKEAKQAEFLVHGSFPWGLIERIGVYSAGVAQQAGTILQGATHRPPVEIRPDWYY